MIDEENIDKYIKRYEKKIRESYQINFGRNISDQEIKNGVSSLLSRMRDDFKKMPDFSEKNFDHYMNGNNLDLIFSPSCIYSEINTALIQVGSNKFLSLNKYKRLREMEVVARLCLAIRKTTGDVWMIRTQDNPDILLSKINNKSLKKKGIFDILQVEIMTIPENESNKWNNSFVSSLVDFIKDKKFNKRYGQCELLISLNITKMGVPFIDISNEIAKIDNNPYNSIEITAMTNEDSTDVTVIRIYPSFSKIDFSLAEEPNIWY
jgi:hypothetical protein